MEASGRGSVNQWTVIYDGDCGFCRWMLALLLRADTHRRLRPLALGVPESDDLLAALTPDQRAASPAPSRLTRPHVGGAAGSVLALLPGGRMPAQALSRAPRATDRGYRWVADHRSVLGRAIPGGVKRRATRLIAARTAEPRA